MRTLSLFFHFHSSEVDPMQVIRFSDLVAQGQVAGKRVFIRADLNVPQDDAGHITEDTRIRASIPCIWVAPPRASSSPKTLWHPSPSAWAS